MSAANRRISTRSAFVATVAQAHASCGASSGAGIGKHRSAQCSTSDIRSQRPFSSLPRSFARSVQASAVALKHSTTSDTVAAGRTADRSAGRTILTAAAPPASASSSTIALNDSKSGNDVGTLASFETGGAAGGGSAASRSASAASAARSNTASSRPGSDVAKAARPRDAANNARRSVRSSSECLRASARPHLAIVVRTSTAAA
mmetsp:Transcript_9574/g.29049  ORF Transcript_9574/g.29049 Transcript_9574/m.29049 type:complete len:204 (-) Transcript_9574:271-882(-)